MEAPFKFPSQPLHQLSPERLNSGTRRPSTATSRMSSAIIDAENPSPHSSPTRKPKANLFADYDPHRSPVKETGFSLTGSPSLPEIHAFRSHGRTNSDVQGLVKRFEHLDVRDRDAESAERRKRHEAELRRAQIGREEAENDVARLREETRRLKKEGDESRDRERKVCKRLEIVMEEFSNFKEAHASQLAVYKDDSRKIRKEAFKSSSAVLKLQEELKSTRNTMRITQQGIDMEKRKVQQREQEAFEAQYQLVAVQEELEKLRVHLQTVQEEKDALKTSLKEEEVARVAAEGMIALPMSTPDEYEPMSSPRRKSPTKRNASPFSDDKENAGVVTRKMLDTRRFDEELARERRMRRNAEELADFLRLECHFRCCPCRSSDTSGHDQNISVSPDLGQAFEEIRNEMQAILSPSTVEDVDRDMHVAGLAAAEMMEDTEELHTVIHVKLEKSPDIEMEQATPVEVDIPAEDFHRSITMAEETSDERLVRERMETCAVEDEEGVPEDETIQTPRTTPAALTPEPEHDSVEAHPEGQEDEESATPLGTSIKVPLLPSSPRHDSPPAAQSTPYRPVSRTYTTTIPMKFTPVKPTFAVGNYDAEEKNHELTAPPADSPRSRHDSAPTFDRAAALAAIAYRRGRAKSIADGQMTPRKQMLQGTVSRTERRDVSAPTLGQKASAANVHVSKGGSASAGRAVGSRSRIGMR